MPTEIKRILFVRLHGLGDVLMATPAIRAVRNTWPDATLDMLIGHRAAPAVSGNPCLDHIFPVEEKWFFEHNASALLRLGLDLRKKKYDRIVLFSRSAMLHLWARLLVGGRTVSHRRHAGWLGAAKEDRHDEAEYEVQKNLRLLHPLGVYHPSSHMQLSISNMAIDKSAALLKDLDPSNYVVMAPGGGENPAWNMRSKRWPLDSFAALARTIHQHWGAAVVVIGSAGDGQRASRMATLSQGALVDATHVDDLEVSARMIEKARLLVCNDSVAMHMGVLLKTPTVALFGPTNPAAVLPRRLDRLAIVRAHVACAPCFWQDSSRVTARDGRAGGRTCNRAQDPCMATISVKRVWKAVQDIDRTMD